MLFPSLARGSLSSPFPRKKDSHQEFNKYQWDQHLTFLHCWEGFGSVGNNLRKARAESFPGIMEADKPPKALEVDR
jgi:hypothetical protein